MSLDGGAVMPVTLLIRDAQLPGSARVVRLDSADNVLWEVAPEGDRDDFVEVAVEGAIVKAWTWNGYLYRIGIEDGQIIDIEFVK
ncbi:MAG TPA: hypothetical protein VF605_17170 [Allosphingosinicella sp.]|jgi:hypothetical protein